MRRFWPSCHLRQQLGTVQTVNAETVSFFDLPSPGRVPDQSPAARGRLGSKSPEPPDGPSAHSCLKCCGRVRYGVCYAVCSVYGCNTSHNTDPISTATTVRPTARVSPTYRNTNMLDAARNSDGKKWVRKQREIRKRSRSGQKSKTRARARQKLPVSSLRWPHACQKEIVRTVPGRPQAARHAKNEDASERSQTCGRSFPLVPEKNECSAGVRGRPEPRPRPWHLLAEWAIRPAPRPSPMMWTTIPASDSRPELPQTFKSTALVATVARRERASDAANQTGSKKRKKRWRTRKPRKPTTGTSPQGAQAPATKPTPPPQPGAGAPGPSKRGPTPAGPPAARSTSSQGSPASPTPHPLPPLPAAQGDATWAAHVRQGPQVSGSGGAASQTVPPQNPPKPPTSSAPTREQFEIKQLRAQVASLTRAMEALANRPPPPNPTPSGQAPEAMDSASSEQRDTTAILAPIEARLNSLEGQVASIVTTIEDRLAAALQTVFASILGMIVAQLPQLASSTRRPTPKLKRVNKPQTPRPLPQMAEANRQPTILTATPAASPGSSGGAPLDLSALLEATQNSNTHDGGQRLPHWGYRREERRGRKLAELISTMGLTILTDPTHPTRIGSSVTRDTCPDLTLTKNIRHADWLNTEETLGSDHCIVITTIRTHPLTRPHHQAKLPDWTKFRSAYSNSTPIAYQGYNTWSQHLVHSLRQTEQTVQLSEATPAVDNHLLHLWEARHSLLLLAFQCQAVVKWKLLDDRAPRWRGWSERVITSTKDASGWSLGRNSTNAESLATVICEVRAIVNTGPLMNLESSPNELQPPAQSHFLLGRHARSYGSDGSGPTFYYFDPGTMDVFVNYLGYGLGLGL
ncbi:hypothetical protein HPB52_022481 [Rhipicephalus sanguineus]|uniref:Endonuclease/exonuclease/phosphatase domain-containing protein n=1 Tax=Rhipicephalus sanguineus TaxID=34632 RepID=A0A9D4T2U5_RHISA|nr:hypothetical protein HPB52_022481 [Rhipicephalus sanguineus]